MGRKLQYLSWHGGGEEGNLDISREELEDVLDLLLEASAQHLVSLVQDEQSEVVWDEEALLHHLLHSTGSADYHVDSRLELLDVFLHRGAARTRVHADSCELSNALDDLKHLIGELSRVDEDENLSMV